INCDDISLLSPTSFTSPSVSSTVVTQIKKKRKRRVLEDQTFRPDFDSAEDDNDLNRTCLTQGNSPFSSSDVLSGKSTKKKMKRASQKISMVNSDSGDKYSNQERFSSAANCQSSAGSTTDLSIRSIKKKRKRKSEKTSSMDFSYQSAAEISCQGLLADSSCFKTPKKLKRKNDEEADGSPVKRRSFEEADVCSDKKARKRKKKKKSLCDISG
ncbi:hypothetical protein OSTOST_16801, partial [Ostertagia ostertagi]